MPAPTWAKAGRWRGLGSKSPEVKPEDMGGLGGYVSIQDLEDRYEAERRIREREAKEIE